MISDLCSVRLTRALTQNMNEIEIDAGITIPSNDSDVFDFALLLKLVPVPRSKLHNTLKTFIKFSEVNLMQTKWFLSNIY